jgi:trimethylamine:corrinoid methyltransferase-like protein
MVLLTVLSDEEVEQIHAATLRILDETGPVLEDSLKVVLGKK